MIKMIRKEQWDGVLADVGLGLSVTDAAANNKMSKESVFKRKYKDKEFRDQFNKALITPKRQSIGIVRKASVTIWQAAAWWLERKFPDEFGLRQKLEYAIDNVIVAIVSVLNTKIPKKCPHCNANLDFKTGIIKELEFLDRKNEEKEDKKDEPNPDIE